MAKWTVTPGTVGNSMSGAIQYEGHKGESSWQIYQDEKPFLEEVKREREQGAKDNILGAKKFATIPDIVAIEVMEKYGIDIHDPRIMGDKQEMMRFKRIIMTEYPHLVVNKA